MALAVHGGPPPQGGTSLISPVSTSARGSPLPPSSQPCEHGGETSWDPCSLLPPWSALLLTEKQTPKYPNGLKSLKSPSRTWLGRTQQDSRAELPGSAACVYTNTQGQEVLDPQPDTAWDLVQGCAATSVGMEWGEIVRGSPSSNPLFPFQLTETFFPSQFPLKQHRGNPNRN